MTPEPKAPHIRQCAYGLSWREILQSSADSAQTDGFALERLIDWQRDPVFRRGEGR